MKKQAEQEPLPAFCLGVLRLPSKKSKNWLWRAVSIRGKFVVCKEMALSVTHSARPDLSAPDSIAINLQ
jgi:cytochrome oxidase assembly protein ShyY1